MQYFSNMLQVTLRLGFMQMALHGWKDAVAVRACGNLQLAVIDAATLSEELILEPSSLSVVTETCFLKQQVRVACNMTYAMTYV